MAIQELANLKPHAADDCPLCTLRGSGHRACQTGCGRHATVQHRRHATAQEYAAIPEGLRPIDGVAHVAVFTCEDCAPPAICEHLAPAASPCAACGAVGDAPCTKPDGTPRPAPHSARAVPPPSAACDHAHREDCDITSCRCGEDQPAAREPRPPEPPRDIAAEHRAQEVLAQAERNFLAWLLEQHGGDKRAAGQAAIAEFTKHLDAAAEAYDAGPDAPPGSR